MRIAALLLFWLAQDKPPEKPVAYATTKEAMSKVQLVIGDWKCTGQHPRESKKEPWTEKVNWNFRIDKDLYQLQMTAKDGAFWSEALLGYDLKKKVFTLEAVLAAGGRRAYEGTLREKDRELTLEQAGEEWPKERVIFSLLRDNRFLMTFETQADKGKSWEELARLGCTKEGVPFVRGEGPVCIVTGGGASIEVSYKGKTYYVC